MPRKYQYNNCPGITLSLVILPQIRELTYITISYQVYVKFNPQELAPTSTVVKPAVAHNLIKLKYHSPLTSQGPFIKDVRIIRISMDKNEEITEMKSQNHLW